MKKTVKKTITMLLALTLAANGMIFSTTAAETAKDVSLENVEVVIDELGDILDVHPDNFEEFAASVEKVKKMVDKLSDDEKSSLRNFEDYQMAVDYCDAYRAELEYLREIESVHYTREIDEETGQPLLKMHSDRYKVSMKMDAGVYEASAGDTIKITVRISDVTEACEAVLTNLIYDPEVFEVVSVKPGSEFKGKKMDLLCHPLLNNEEYKTGIIVMGYDDIDTGSIAPGTECDLAEIELKIKDGVKDGNYALPFFLTCKNDLPVCITPYVWRQSNRGVDFRGGLVKVGEGNPDPQSLLYPPYDNYYFVTEEEEKTKEEYMKVLAERLKSNSGEVVDEDASLGDVNCNGVIDITDISVLSIALADKKPLEGESARNADVNKSGKIDIVDLAYLRQFVSKKITRFYFS